MSEDVVGPQSLGARLVTSQQRAAEVIGREFGKRVPGFPVGSIPGDLARALADVQPPVLMPDGIQVSYDVESWRESTGEWVTRFNGGPRTLGGARATVEKLRKEQPGVEWRVAVRHSAGISE